MQLSYYAQSRGVPREIKIRDRMSVVGSQDEMLRTEKKDSRDQGVEGSIEMNLLPYEKTISHDFYERDMRILWQLNTQLFVRDPYLPFLDIGM